MPFNVLRLMNYQLQMLVLVLLLRCSVVVFPKESVWLDEEPIIQEDRPCSGQCRLEMQIA